MNKKTSIFIAAGDPSADYPGKNLIEAINRGDQKYDLFGLGGPMMQGAGLEELADYRDLAVLGFWEVIPKYPFFRKLLNQCTAEIENRKPAAIILIDYPGFNLRLAKRAKKLGIPIIYYISPQLWAWGEKRVNQIRELVDMMLVIFPFETDFYKKYGIEAHFVGHPLVDRYGDIPQESICRKQLEIPENKKLIALLPGSRRQEIKRMFPAMVGAADLLPHSNDEMIFVVGAVKNIEDELYKSFIGDRKIKIVRDSTPELMRAADLAIVASGTATIETAFFETPMIVVYKTGWLTYQIARRLVKIDTIAMANIVAGEKIVPELIQRNVKAKMIAAEAGRFLSDKDLYQYTVKQLHEVRNKLGEGCSADKAVALLREKKIL